MDAKTYWKTKGVKHCKALCERCGTSYDYFKHVCHGRKRMGIDLALSFVRETKGEIDLFSLTPPKIKPPRGAVTRKSATKKAAELVSGAAK